MKKLLTGALFTGVMLVSGFAESELAAGKEYETPVELPACFTEHEFQIDVFGAYIDGNSREHAGVGNNNGRNFENFPGSLILRFPDDAASLAPYLFAGGGFHIDGDH
ncbi:MAG: hypothetical protein JWL59_2766 [Chthoniobacteraceae bacterium]|nr:hypothetical protein [Chthoniobacteraceae bacterium]